MARAKNSNDTQLEWQNVKSSNVGSIAYDKNDNSLHVIFIPNYAHYQYLDFGPEMWDAMQAAPSKGKFIWQNVRYKFTTIGPL